MRKTLNEAADIRDSIKSTIVALGLSVALGGVAFAQDLTGTWRLSYKLNEGASLKRGQHDSAIWGERLNVVQEGGKISGGYVGMYGEGPITGTLNGGEFSIQYQYSAGVCGIQCARLNADMYGKELMAQMIWTGVVQGTTIMGTFNIGTFVGHPSTATSPAEIFDELPVEIKEKLKQEEDKKFAECNSHRRWAEFVDCGCQTDIYMNYRISKGPGPTEFRISEEVGSKSSDGTAEIDACINDAAIIDHYRVKCVSNWAAQVKDSEGFCNCYASAMAKEFRKNRNLSKGAVAQGNRESIRNCPMNKFR